MGEDKKGNRESSPRRQKLRIARTLEAWNTRFKRRPQSMRNAVFSLHPLNSPLFSVITLKPPVHRVKRCSRPHDDVSKWEIRGHICWIFLLVKKIENSCLLACLRVLVAAGPWLNQRKPHWCNLGFGPFQQSIITCFNNTYLSTAVERHLGKPGSWAFPE